VEYEGPVFFGPDPDPAVAGFEQAGHPRGGDVGQGDRAEPPLLSAEPRQAPTGADIGDAVGTAQQGEDPDGYLIKPINVDFRMEKVAALKAQLLPFG